MDSVPGIGNIGRKKDKSDSYCQGAYILMRSDTGYIAAKSINKVILDNFKRKGKKTEGPLWGDDIDTEI